jgi:hypothetical protein
MQEKVDCSDLQKAWHRIQAHSEDVFAFIEETDPIR